LEVAQDPAPGATIHGASETLNTHQPSPVGKGEGNISTLISTRTDKPESSPKTGEDKIFHPTQKIEEELTL
jgi:hypothetical protein